MDAKKFGYYVGMFVGIALKAAIYAAGAYGIVTQLWNHQIPYVPVILILVFHGWTKIIGMYEGMGYLINHPQVAKVDTSDVEKIISMVNFRNMYRGGPN